MDEKLKKLTFRVPDSVAQEIDTYAEMAGLTRSAFLSMACVIGMRALGRQMAPERFITPDLVQKMQEAGFGSFGGGETS